MMSLWCGACRKEVFGGFGILYRMPIVDGKPRMPTADNEYVPPNSAVCASCWAQLPVVDHTDKFELLIVTPSSRGAHVYAFASADSGTSLYGSKQWSDIEASDRYVYLPEGLVKTHLPRALDIIRRDAQDKGAILFDQA